MTKLLPKIVDCWSFWEKRPKLKQINLNSDLQHEQSNNQPSLQDEIHSLNSKHEEEIMKLKGQLQQLQEEKDTSKERLAKTSLSVDDLKNNSEMFHFYTGFKDYETLRIFFDLFSTAAAKLIYYKSNTNSEKLSEHGEKRGPKRSMSQEQELFLVLVRLQCSLLEKDIAYRAGISVSHFSRIFITWVDFLSSRLRQ